MLTEQSDGETREVHVLLVRHHDPHWTTEKNGMEGFDEGVGAQSYFSLTRWNGTLRDLKIVAGEM